MKRRTFLRNTSLATGALSLGMPYACSTGKPANTADHLKVTAITSGEKQHWFGYYDKWQIDVSGRYALGAEVDTFFRSPSPKDVLRVV